MSDTLKGLLIIASVLTVGWILRKIRKNKVKMEDAIFWIFLRPFYFCWQSFRKFPMNCVVYSELCHQVIWCFW